MRKHLFLLLLFCLCPILVLAQTNSDEHFQKGLDLMKEKKYEQAIGFFQKAKLGYSTADKKAECDTKIEECRLKPKSKPKLDPTPTPVAKTIASLKFDKDYLVLEPSLATPNISVLIKAQGISNLRVGQSPDWVYGKIENINGNTVLILTAEENETSAKREAEIEIFGDVVDHKGTMYSAKLTVKQNGRLVFDIVSLLFEKNPQGNAQFITVSAPEETDWNISSFPSWCLATKYADDKIRVECTKSKEKERSGQIVITANPGGEYALDVIQSSTNIINKGAKRVKELFK